MHSPNRQTCSNAKAKRTNEKWNKKDKNKNAKQLINNYWDVCALYVQHMGNFFVKLDGSVSVGQWNTIYITLEKKKKTSTHTNVYMRFACAVDIHWKPTCLLRRYVSSHSVSFSLSILSILIFLRAHHCRCWFSFFFILFHFTVLFPHV